MSDSSLGMKIIKYNLKNAENVILETASVLRRGGLVIFPSDTVYGLLVAANNEAAVEKLIKFKNRPPGKPISVFLADMKMLKANAKVNASQAKLLGELLPGPFTVILDSRHMVSPRLESERGTIGLRIPDFKLINDLVSEVGFPITATSANLSGRSPHYSADSLLKQIGEEKKAFVDLVVDAGKLPRNKPSTIIDLTKPKVTILRRGEIVMDKSKTYISDSSASTGKVGYFLMGKYSFSITSKPLVFIIEGELGAGKTVFVKGVGERMGVEGIVSPTFVIYYEYGNFYHFDLYQIEESQEFNYLGIEKLLKPGNVLCFEWGEKIGELYDLLKAKANIVYVKIEYLSEKQRKITVNSDSII